MVSSKSDHLVQFPIHSYNQSQIVIASDQKELRSNIFSTELSSRAISISSHWTRMAELLFSSREEARKSAIDWGVLLC